jgi:hypothetical protein
VFGVWDCAHKSRTTQSVPHLAGRYDAGFSYDFEINHVEKVDFYVVYRMPCRERLFASAHDGESLIDYVNNII